jgi:hypothetical protein
MNFNQRDRENLRKLAAELAELAARPQEQDKIQGWKRLNSLQPQRPMLWITEIPYGEVGR